MENVTRYPNGSRSTHRFEPLTPETRPQDVGRDGHSLRFATLEHHGIDVCPEAIEVADTDGRSCVYLVQEQFADGLERPCDRLGDGSELQFEALEHGGEIADDMPQAIRVADLDGHWSLYPPVSEDGRAVDSRGFTLELG